MTDLLRVRGLRKSYGDKVVLHDIDLDVAAGDVVCLIGSSGSGKSTLLRCLNLLEEIDDGLVELDGVDISDPRVDRRAVRSRMGMVFQAYNLFPHLSVLDNVTLAPRKVHGVGRREAEDRARELLRRFGLGDKADAHPDQLSGGQQQRVALVRALAAGARACSCSTRSPPRWTPSWSATCSTRCARLAEAGTTLVLATHEMRFARDVASRVCFLDDGRILEAGPPEEIFTAPREERTRQFLRRVLAD